MLAAGITSVALLGTRFTMRETFYRERLGRHGLTGTRRRPWISL